MDATEERFTLEQQKERWTGWDPHGRPELEPRSLFMPQHLLAAVSPQFGDSKPMNVAAQIGMFLTYHLDRGSYCELMIFTQTRFVGEIIQSCLDLDSETGLDDQVKIEWGRTPEIWAEERIVLIRVCVRAYSAAAFHAEGLIGVEPLPEVTKLVQAACKVAGVFDAHFGGAVLLGTRVV